MGWTVCDRSRQPARAALSAFALVAVLGLSAAAAAAPVDGLTLRMSPSDPVVRKGDVVTFEVVVVNASTRDFVREGAAQGVQLVLETPRGLLWQPGSGRATTVGGADVTLLDPDQAASALVLARDLDGEPQNFNLGRDQTLTFRYQLAASSPLQVDTVAHHRAFLRAGDGTVLSDVVVASVRVEPDPELDEAVVYGRVFCDADGDGRPGAGEVGVGGARVVADHGWYVDSDADGRFHLRRFEPGMHLLKLDVASLPPGATLTTSDKVALYLTRGLAARAEFGVKCPELETVRPPEVVRLGEDGAPAESDDVEVETTPLPVVTVVGNVNDGALAVDARPLAPLAARLAIEGRERDIEGKLQPVSALNVPWTPGPLKRPVVFRMTVPPETAALPGLTWRLAVARVDGPVAHEVRTFFGQGAPPATLSWDGTEAGSTVSVLDRGARYDVRLLVADGRSGVAASAPVALGASWGGATREISREAVRGELFDKKMEPHARLLNAIVKAAGERAKIEGARLLVEVHLDATEFEEQDLTRTRRGAYFLNEWAKKRLKLGDDLFVAVGLGGTRPLRPNIGDRNRAFNRRVEIVVLPPEDPAKLVAPPLEKVRPRVRIGGRDVRIGKDGVFVETAPRPSGQALAITVHGADGAVRSVAFGDGTAAVVVPTPTPTAPGEPEVNEHGELVVPEAAELHPPAGTVPPREPEVTVTAPAAGDGEEVPGAQPLETDPLRRFGGRALRESLGTKSILLGAEELAANGKRITAGKLEVTLPPKGIPLTTTRLFVRGTSDPANAVTVNGRAVRLGADGAFAELVEVPSGASTLVIVSTDPLGYQARVEWPITVTDSELFLLALADGVGGQVGARLQELGPYAKTDNGTLYMAGRGALYAKARISGTALAKDLFVTAHLDTAKKRDFTAFFDQVVDPARDYVIYGDAASDVQDAAARGPFYVLVEADRSKLELGSIRTDIAGIDLLRYDRTFYGGKLDVQESFAEGWDTKLEAFVSEDNRELVRRHDELRATGGSLYYLSSHEIVEGSEQVWIVVREMDTGLELGRERLSRDVQYRVDYVTGRVTFASPVSSTMDALFQIDGYQPFTGRSVLDGHQVWVHVDYESRSVSAAGNIAWGVHAKQTLGGVVEVGGGYIREGRPAGSGASEPGEADYALYGAHIKVKLSEHSLLSAEVAHSKNKDGVSLGSSDGGLSYREIRRAADESSGDALKLNLDARVGELFDVEGLDLRVRGWWQLLDSGYHATGLANLRGSETWGGAVTWNITGDDRLDVRYDGGTTLVADSLFDTGERAVKRNRLHARYAHDFGRVEGTVEAGFGQHRDDDDGLVHDTGAVALGAAVKLTRRLTATVSQEALVSGDDAVLGDSFNDRMTTNVGLDYRVAKDLSLRLLESVRWNGDNATRLGLRTQLDEATSVYVEDRFKPGEDNGRLLHTLVLGAESALGPDGRAYGEYRLADGVDGRTNLAVIGLARRLQLAPGVRVAAGYERSQAVDGVEAGFTRDVVSGGLEITGSDVVQFGGLYEVRLDHPADRTERPEKVQALVRNSLDVRLAEDVTLLGVFNYTITQNLDSRSFDKEELEATVALAWRPEQDDVTFIGRYSRLVSRQLRLDPSVGTLSGLGGLGGLAGLDTGTATSLGSLGAMGGLLSQEREKNVSDLVSLMAIIELPLRLQLTEKLVWRHTSTALTGLATSDYDVLLWINRLAFHLVARFDVAAEFRMAATLGDAAVLENGGLLEVAYHFYDFVRLGVGYSFNGVAGEILPGSMGNDTDSGFYVRLTGTY
ncbi:MAG: hypothetical protein EP329_25585 [Deltaproteobacteria bacterium]|nr:MAG: hypothetical protein EP329_25585 [Deltaproteobacteria bacterium]